MKVNLVHIGFQYWNAGKRFFEEQYTYRASSLAFTTLLAIVPLLSVIVFFISMFPVFSNIVSLAEQYILQHFVPDAGVTVEQYFQVFVSQTMRLPMLGLALLFISAMLLINTIVDTLNDIWSAPRRRKRLNLVLLYWAVLFTAPLILGLSVFVTSYFVSLEWVSGATQLLGLTAFLLAIIPVLINTLIFSLLYIVIPNIDVKWRAGLIGGFTAALLFEAAHYAFKFYFEQFHSYQVIYGAFAAIPIFLLWLYVFWFIVLYGALLSRELATPLKQNSN